MFSLLIDHPLAAFLVWSLLAVLFGFVIGRAIDIADTAEQPEQDDPDTAVLDWSKAPREWVL